MKLDIKKVCVIKDLCTWFQYAEPEGGESQWKEGRSAMEFARYMLSSNGNLPQDISKYLESIGVKDKAFECYPEEITSFDNCNLGRGSGRHHDALLVSDNFIVGIEAKVSEPFDYSIVNKIERAKKNSDSGNNMRTRINNSLKLLNQDFDERNLNLGDNLMYQLVSASVGTIIESINRNKSQAAFLIIEFVGDVKKDTNYEEKLNTNQKAYDEFLTYLNLKDKDDKNRYIDFDDEALKLINKKGRLRLWINKIRINIDREECKYSCLS